MPLQIINDPYRSLTSGYGTALGTGLEELSNIKMQQLAERQQIERGSQFWQGLGLPKEVAYQFASAPESIQKSLLDRLEGTMLGGQQQQQPQQVQQMPTYGEQLAQQPEFQSSRTPSGRRIPGIPIPPFTREGIPTSQQVPGATPQEQQEQQGSFKIGANPAERRHREDLALKQQSLKLKEQKAQAAIEEKVMPFVEREYARAVQAEESKSIAQQMKDILLANRKDWPTWGGYLPDKLQLNSNVREYARLANNLVVSNSNMLRGVPTNFKTKLVQAGKVDLSQPIETQLLALDSTIENSDKILDIPKRIEQSREENGGRYPRDLAGRIYGKESGERVESPKNKVSESKREIPAIGAKTSQPEGIIARNKVTGKPEFRVSNGRWIAYKV